MDGERRNPIDFGSRGQRSRSTLALCVQDLVGRIQTIVFAQSLSNFTCKLWMMRGGDLLILCRGVIGQGQLCPPARGCHALHCLVFFCCCFFFLDIISLNVKLSVTFTRIFNKLLYRISLNKARS